MLAEAILCPHARGIFCNRTTDVITDVYLATTPKIPQLCWGKDRCMDLHGYLTCKLVPCLKHELQESLLSYGQLRCPNSQIHSAACLNGFNVSTE